MPKNQKTLIYISITLFSYILNCMITNPSWTKEFPPKLPTTAFVSLYLIPNLLFLALSFEPIETRKRCFTLMTLLLLNLSIPLAYRLKYRPLVTNLLTANAAIWSFKMSLFIKYNRKYLPHTKINQKKEFTPFALTLFHWRHDSYIIPPSKVEPPTFSQIDEKIKSRVLVFAFKLMIYESFMFLFASVPLNISDKPFQIRVIEYFTKGIPPHTINSVFHCVCFLGFVFSYLSLAYDATTILSLIVLRYLTMTQSKDLENHHLVKSGFLTSLQFSSIKDYLIEYTFNTEHCFNNPFMSTNPREFWSRWQSMYTETFRELGYLPFRNLCINLGFPRKVSNSVGVFGAFLISALLHEYFVICLFNCFSGENLYFFMFHGVLLIIWEGIFGQKRVMKESEKKGDKIDNVDYNDFRKNFYSYLKWLLLVTINISALPGFIEPLLRSMDRWTIPSFFTDVHQNVIQN